MKNLIKIILVLVVIKLILTLDIGNIEQMISSLLSGVKNEIQNKTKDFNSIESKSDVHPFILDSTRYDQETNDYFEEITMYSEYGDGKKSQPYRWTNDVKIFIEGERRDYLLTELGKIVKELNHVIDPIHISVVESKKEANLFLYFGTMNAVLQKHPKLDKDLLKKNWGYFEIYENESIAFIDLNRTGEDYNAQKHLLREELTQTLGLSNDSWKYKESIFYQGWTTTTEFSEMDIRLIDLLYNN